MSVTECEGFVWGRMWGLCLGPNVAGYVLGGKCGGFVWWQLWQAVTGAAVSGSAVAGCVWGVQKGRRHY